MIIRIKILKFQDTLKAYWLITLHKKNITMYVVMNKMQCLPEFREKFEELFQTRAHAIDRMQGFKGMWLLRSETQTNEYIVLTL
ncbi:MAG: antibiotic biosynthesis monooxygenase family protein [Bacteroidales bacterium]